MCSGFKIKRPFVYLHVYPMTLTGEVQLLLLLNIHLGLTGFSHSEILIMLVCHRDYMYDTVLSLSTSKEWVHENRPPPPGEELV